MMDVLNWMAEHWVLTVVLVMILTNGATNLLGALAVLFRGRS